MKVNWQLNKNSILVLHVLVWVMIFLLPFIFSSENVSSKDADDLAFRNLNTVTNLFWMGLFYLNGLVLIPKLFNKHKYIYFVFSLILSFCIIMLLHGALFKPFVQGHDFNFFRSSSHNIIPFLFTVTVSTTAVLTGSRILYSVRTPGGTRGFLSAPMASVTNATSFVINSTSATETSTLDWWIDN